jgi:hypothetical protein
MCVVLGRLTGSPSLGSSHTHMVLIIGLA